MMTILISVSAFLVGVAVTAVVAVVLQSRRSSVAERVLILENVSVGDIRRSDRNSREQQAPIRESTSILDLSGSDNGKETLQLYVKLGEATSEMILLDEVGLLEYQKIVDEPRTGDVYIGRVMNIDPGVIGLFIDIGEDHDGFMNISDDSNNDSAIPYEIGDPVLCQIIGLPRGHKGYKVSEQINLHGYYLNLLRYGKGKVGLGDLYDYLMPSEAGLLAARWRAYCIETRRSLFVNQEYGVPNRAAYERDFGILKGKMDAFETQLSIHRNSPPLRLHHNDILEETVANVLSAISRAPVPLKSLTLIGPFAEDLSEKIRARQHFAKDDPLAQMGIRQAYLSNGDYNGDNFEATLDALRATLKGQAIEITCSTGANIVIEATEALTSVDVNSSRAFRKTGETEDEYARRINLDATHTLARALRMFNCSGIIVVDYPGMNDANRRELPYKVEECLEENKPLLRRDPKTDVGIVSPVSGVLDITRQRLGYSLWEEARISEEAEIGKAV